MRIIIAGGSGLIGSALTAQLTAAGDEVIILSRNPSEHTGLPAGAKAIQWDGKTLQEWGQVIEVSDAIVNLTGENLSGKGILPTRWTAERKRRLVDSRVNSGKVLSEAIARVNHKPKVFVQASGVGFYGTNPNKTFTEHDQAGNDFSADLCKDWEASSQPVEAMGVRRAVIRNGVVLSTKSGALRPIVLPYRLFVGGPLGNGRQIYSWIHIDDEIYAIQFLIHNDLARGIFNLTSPNPVSNSEFGRTVAKVLKRPHYFPLPGFVMRLMFGEVATMVLEGQRVLPQRLLENGFTFKFPTLEAALSDLLRD